LISLGVIIQHSQPSAFVTTSTTGVVTSQHQGYQPSGGYPPVTGYQQPYVYPAGSYPQGAYPPQQFVTTAAPMGGMQPTYSVDVDSNKTMPPPPYSQ